MIDHPIYRYSSIVRPLDPRWRGNKVVLVLMPVAFVAGLFWSVMEEQGWQTGLVNGLVFAWAVLGSWALGRELLPDDHAAAFVSMALAFLACLAFHAPGLLSLFTALGLVRIVNRSSGLEARLRDSIGVSMLVIVTVYATQSPWLGGVAALAFVLDASLKSPLHRQLLFAALCLASMVVYIVDYDVAWLSVQAPDALLQWLAILCSLVIGLNIYLFKEIRSRGDVGGKRLNLNRVRSGSVIVLLILLQGLDKMPEVILLLATIAGLCLSMAFRRSFRSTAKDLPQQ